MQQIADWLESLGLSEYVQRFAENEIDFLILPDLTDQDLEKIGVTSLGHRRKILRAATALNNASTALRPLPARRRLRRAKLPASGVTSRLCSAIWSARPGFPSRSS